MLHSFNLLPLFDSREGRSLLHSTKICVDFMCLKDPFPHTILFECFTYPKMRYMVIYDVFFYVHLIIDV